MQYFLKQNPGEEPPGHFIEIGKIKNKGLYNNILLKRKK